MGPTHINQRIAYLNGYMSNIDKRINNQNAAIENKIKELENKTQPQSNPIAQGFQNVLEKVTAKITGNDTTNKAAIVQSQRTISTKDNFSMLPAGFEEYINDISKSENLSPNLLKSLIKQESGGNPNAKSSAGALGLTQLMPQTAREMKVFNPMNPYQNLKGGAKYLSQMLDKFNGNIQNALAAYNAGPKAVEKYNGIPPYPETQNYVKSIMADYLNREGYRPVDVRG